MHKGDVVYAPVASGKTFFSLFEKEVNTLLTDALRLLGSIL